MTLGSLIALAAVTVGTWNGEWFPSGRAEHRAAPEIEAVTIQVAGQRLRRGLDAADPTGTNDVILCLNEIRGPRVAEELCRAVGRTNLAVAVVTGYRRRDRYDQQQDVVATTLSRRLGGLGDLAAREARDAAARLRPGAGGLLVRRDRHGLRRPS